MDLVTVTCDRDFKHIALQAESIQKFVKPCTHWIIVNENEPNLNKWFEVLAPFYTKHTFKLLPRVYNVADDYSNIDPRWDWRVQQLQKLYISTLLDDDYLVLDSHNFFIKPTDIEEFREIQGSGVTQRLDEPKFKHIRHQRFLEKYCIKLGIDKPELVLCEFTPFKIQLDVLRNFKDLDNIYEYLIPKPYVTTNEESTSEFIFYSMLLPIIPTMNKNQKKWDLIHNLPYKEGAGLSDYHVIRTFNAINNENIKILTFHHSIVHHLTPTDTLTLNNILEKLTLRFRF